MFQLTFTGSFDALSQVREAATAAVRATGGSPADISAAVNATPGTVIFLPEGNVVEVREA